MYPLTLLRIALTYCVWYATAIVPLVGDHLLDLGVDPLALGHVAVTRPSSSSLSSFGLLYSPSFQLPPVRKYG